jgi:arylsulfatase
VTNRREFLSAWAAAPALGAASRRPNIVLILADDMGYSDIGCYGGEIRTPNLDRLARGGTRFTQFYNTARCCPTRASLLTGLHPHQVGMGHMVDNPKPFAGYTGDLSQNCVTIAEALQPAGYRTYMSGKWHVTPVTESKHNWPRQRGFDRYYGIIHGASSFFDPVTLVRDNEAASADGAGFFLTDALAQNAETFVREHDTRDPFFLYLAFTSPHWPMHALDEDIARYRGRYRQGWDALRAERHRRMIELGIVERRWAITERDASVAAWQEEKDKAWQERRMEVYAAMVDRMDQNIGRLLRALEETRQLDNTLILFLSDNGGCAEELRPGYSAFHVPKSTRQGTPVVAGNRPELLPGGPETYQSYGVGWANASNTPFRLYKHWTHEGGIATPLIAHWPGQARAGALSPQPGQLVDIMATCLDAAGAPYPRERRGKAVQPLEGASLLPALRGKKIARRQPLFWEHEGNRAVRDGRWKLVSRFPGDWELFDLKADRTETRNLATQFPERARKLAAAWDAWAARAQVQAWAEVQKAPRTPAPIPTSAG